MGLLVNPNDAKATAADVAELIRRQSGADKSVNLTSIAKQLNISEKRAKEIADEASNHGKGYSSRVCVNAKGEYRLRF